MAGGPEGSLVIETFGSSFSPVWGLILLLLLGDGVARLFHRVGLIRFSGIAETAGMRILLGLAMIPFLCLAMDLTSVPITRVSLSVVMLAVFGAGLLVWRRGLARKGSRESAPTDGDATAEGAASPAPTAAPLANDSRRSSSIGKSGSPKVFHASSTASKGEKQLLRSPAALVLIFALVTIVVACAVQTNLYPSRSYDALVGWDVVGKVMAYEGKLRSSVFTNIQFNAQCAYAPFCATNQGYWYLFFPLAYQFWVPLITAGFCLVMWSRVRRWTGSPTAAGLGTFLVFLPPTLTYHLTVGQTDLPAMVYATLAIFSAAELLRGHGRVASVAFYALIGTVVRSEGVLFAFALSVVGLTFARKGRWGWIWITVVSVAFFAFWNLFVMRFLVGYDPGQYFRRTIDFDPARMAEVIQRAATILATPEFYGEFSALLLVVPVVWIVGVWGTRRGWFPEDESSRLTTLLILIVAVSFVCYLPFFYQWDPDLNPLWTMEHTFKRGVFRFIPSLIVVVIASPPILSLLRRCEPPREGWSARPVYLAAVLLLAGTIYGCAHAPASEQTVSREGLRTGDSAQPSVANEIGSGADAIAPVADEIGSGADTANAIAPVADGIGSGDAIAPVDAAKRANHRRAALLDLDFLIGPVFWPSAGRKFADLLPGEVRVLEVDFHRRASGGIDPVLRNSGANDPVHRSSGGSPGTRVWIWKDGNDLVAAVDENDDGDLEGSSPDSIEDCFVIDYESDGTIDRVVDWMDLDGDGLADRQVLYALPPDASARSLITCFVIDQLDGDRGFWKLDRWEYNQSTVQFLCDFSGNQFFTWGYYREDEARWVSRIENPFCFYDPDGDGLTEVALQFSGEDTEIASLRWSIDSDNDAHDDHPYDYDFSLNALGQVHVPPAELDTLDLRGGQITVLGWDAAAAWGVSAPWQKALLAVDENDHNVDPNDPQQRERWEGVIATPAPGFPDLGGPASGTLNKRYEVCRSLMRRSPALYLSEIDGRIHLAGASMGWIEIDADSNGVRDARLEMEDRDEDGFFDTWLWDGDADGDFESIEVFLDIDESSTRAVPLDYESIRDAERAIETMHGGLSQRARYHTDIARWRKSGKFTPVSR